MDNQDQRELTFGEKAVGLTFNPSNNQAVQQIKERSAALIDCLNDYRNAAGDDGEVKRMLSVAITEAQTAQMWGVKGVTWNLPTSVNPAPNVTASQDQQAQDNTTSAPEAPVA